MCRPYCKETRNSLCITKRNLVLARVHSTTAFLRFVLIIYPPPALSLASFPLALTPSACYGTRQWNPLPPRQKLTPKQKVARDQMIRYRLQREASFPRERLYFPPPPPLKMRSHALLTRACPARFTKSTTAHSSEIREQHVRFDMCVFLICCVGMTPPCHA